MGWILTGFEEKKFSNPPPPCTPMGEAIGLWLVAVIDASILSSPPPCHMTQSREYAATLCFSVVHVRARLQHEGKTEIQKWPISIILEQTITDGHMHMHATYMHIP